MPSPDELLEFLDFSRHTDHGAILRLAALTGLRRSELCLLRWQDVDLIGPKLVVRQAITTADHSPVAGDTRTTRSRRAVHLDPTTAAVVRTRIANANATHLRAANVNVRVVSERLGYASTAFTLDVYGHALPGQQADAAATVAALVDK